MACSASKTLSPPTASVWSLRKNLKMIGSGGKAYALLKFAGWYTVSILNVSYFINLFRLVRYLTGRHEPFFSALRRGGSKPPETRYPSGQAP